MVTDTVASEKTAGCLSVKCHLLMGSKCSSLDVPLKNVTDCAHWQGRIC